MRLILETLYKINIIAVGYLMEEWVTALAITLGVAHMAFDDCVS